MSGATNPKPVFRSRAAPRIPSLDGLRAVSIALVLLAHLNGTRGLPSFLPENEDLGNLGVRAFFVISGYLITFLLLKELASTGGISLKYFYIRRVLRIFPACYLYISIMALLAGVGLITLNRADLFCAFTYTMNYNAGRSWWLGHLWSLAVEEQFYVLWPALLCFAGVRASSRVAVGVILLAPVYRAFLLFFAKSHLEGLGAWFPTIADAVAVGCVLACARDWLGTQPRYLRFLSSRQFLFIPLALFGLNYSFSTKVSFIVEQTLLNIGLALLIDRTVRIPNDVLGRILNTPWAVKIGVLSYSLYLWQQPFLNRQSGGTLQSFPVNLLLTVAATFISYHWIEKPFFALKSRFERTRPAKALEPDRASVISVTD